MRWIIARRATILDAALAQATCRHRVVCSLRGLARSFDEALLPGGDACGIVSEEVGE